MKSVIVVFVLVALCNMAYCSILPGTENDANRVVHSAEIVEFINKQANMTWKAGINTQLVGISFMQATKLCGTFLHGPLPPQKKFFEDIKLPSQFDARQQWSYCPFPIRDQANCGSCWAFGTVEAFNDRLCISTKGANQTLVSVGDVVSCCWTCGFGCNGGYPAAAWSHLKNSGTPSEACSPYPLAKCCHHVTCPYQPCGDEAPTPPCHKSCNDSENYSTNRFYAKSSYSVSGVENAMNELVTNGPITAAFTVYEDFLSYKSGVYQHTTGSELGGHAVKILGYGTQDGVDYWLVANSWNETWGDNGYFLIRRGNDECGIEDELVTGLVRL